MDIPERRRSLRIPCENFITYALLRDDGTEDPIRSGSVHCKNISLVGVLFTAFEPLTPGDAIQMHLNIGGRNGSLEDITMLGKVSRCERLKNAETWDIAANIMGVGDMARRLAFVNWLAEKNEEYGLS